MNDNIKLILVISSWMTWLSCIFYSTDMWFGYHPFKRWWWRTDKFLTRVFIIEILLIIAIPLAWLVATI
jgi:hypothetical protein